MKNLAITLTVIILLLTGCANISPHLQLNYQGNQSYYSQHYNEALKYYGQSLDEAKNAGDKQYQAIAMYGLARANAHICNLTDAEKWFRESIMLRETLPDDKYAYLTQNLIEFSRFLLTYNRVKDALPYMDRAAQDLESNGIEQSDPVAFANFLDQYAISLRSIGRMSDAEKISERSYALYTKYSGQKAKYIPELYPGNCKEKG